MAESPTLRVVASWVSPREPGGSNVGQKAEGLLDLPEAWTPPFLAWRGESRVEAADALSDALAELIRGADGARLILRSDGLFSREDARRSLERLREVAHETDALLVLGHEPDDWSRLKRAPDCYA